LGSKVWEEFGRLPYLFKVLDVHDMLSIQVHPSKKEAEKGFQRENEKGIPLTAANRNYKDDNHKPEIMVALGDFWLLHGFLPKNDLMAVLNAAPEFQELVPIFEQQGYRGLYQYVMELDAARSDRILKPLAKRILPHFNEGKLAKSSPDYWAAKAISSAARGKPLDRGIFSIYFFNVVVLKKGEAVFQDAGVPHAYLEGQNMELMANSDNVLRGGLTPKHVDVPELLKHVVFEETRPEVLTGIVQEDNIERIYRCPAPDFQLSAIQLKLGQRFFSSSRTSEVFMVIGGKGEVTEGETVLTFDKGDAFVIFANSDFSIHAQKDTVIFRASTPL
jgi:mannose-6-phosphate isomerase